MSTVVHGPVPGAPAAHEPGAHNVGQWAMAGAAIGFAAAAILIGLVAFIWGVDAGGSLGLGLYVGGFGGAGFGFMMGGMLALPAESRPKHR